MFTIPNLMSVGRILLAFVFCFSYFIPGQRLFSFVILIISGISDVLDGIIARKFNQISDLGKVLDPIADKMTQIAVLFVFAKDKLISWWIFIIVCFIDLILAVGGYYFYIKLKNKAIAAKWYGKAASILFFISMSLTFIFKLSENVIKENELFIISSLFILTVCFILAAAINYILCAIKANQNRKKVLSDSETV